MSIRKIFATGMFRSGTTLLARALNAHPEISFASDPFFEIFKFFRNKFYSNKINNFDAGKPFGDKFLDNNDLNKDFLFNFYNIKIENKELEEIRERIKQKAEQYSPKILPLLENFKGNSVEEILNSGLKAIYVAYPAKNAKAVGFKEVWLEEFIAPLLEKDYYCLHIIRDPRAVIASKKNAESGRYPLLFLIRQWRKSIAFNILNQGKQKYHSIKFETLIKSSEISFKDICKKLELDYHKNLVDFNQFKDGNEKAWEQNSSFERKKDFNKDAISRWKEVLTNEEIAIIEFLCAPEMAYCGYQFTKKPDERVLLNYKDDANKFADWIKKYNYELTSKRKQEEFGRLFLLKNPDIGWMGEPLNKLFFDKRVFNQLKNGY